MSKIKDGVYIGNWRDAQNRVFFVNHKISHVLCSASELRPVFADQYEYLHLPAQDTLLYNISRHFESAADFIKAAIEAGGKILVHCFAGISRSSSFVLAYLIKHEGMNLAEALRLCRNKRKIVSPNPNFLQHLKKWEQLHFKAKEQLPDQTTKKTEAQEEEKQANQGRFMKSVSIQKKGISQIHPQYSELMKEKPSKNFSLLNTSLKGSSERGPLSKKLSNKNGLISKSWIKTDQKPAMSKTTLQTSFFNPKSTGDRFKFSWLEFKGNFGGKQKEVDLKLEKKPLNLRKPGQVKMSPELRSTKLNQSGGKVTEYRIQQSSDHLWKRNVLKPRLNTISPFGDK